MENRDLKNIITIGASAGGIAAVSSLLATFNRELDAAVFIVIHVSRNSMMEVILNIFQKNSPLPCVIAQDQQKIENKTIYLAPADHHMLVDRGTIRITKGAYENHWRPSIDVLFRSAAAAYTACVTGIILTGLLDDGASGMYAIKRCGGICMVQDPEEAPFPDMPNSVLHTIAVDYKVSVGEMGYILADLFSRSGCEQKEVPAAVQLEANIARRLSSNIDDLMRLGDLTPMTCPDCGGSLAKIKDDALARYRCYTGHTFTEKSLENEQIKGIEDSLWVAIRMMEERKNLLLNMDNYDAADQPEPVVSAKKKRIADIQLHVDRLKSMLVSMGGGD